MSQVYLIRHGQAGLRQDYDTLSEVGIQQASRLRAWFQREGVAFDRVISGSLERQKQTARLAVAHPDIDPRFSEFDLDAVYRSLAPRLCAEDPEFAREYQAMQEQMRSADAPVHRQWNGCDVKVFQAWYRGAMPVEGGESWLEFKQRVLEAVGWLREIPRRQTIAVFTSATPVGLILASILDAHDGWAMRLAGACYNSSVTVLRVRDGDISLMGFNSVAHLPEPALRTFR